MTDLQTVGVWGKFPLRTITSEWFAYGELDDQYDYNSNMSSAYGDAIKRLETSR